MTDIPSAAIAAAVRKLRTECDCPNVEDHAYQALEAAGDHIRADERERCVAEIFAYADQYLAPMIGAAYRDAARILNRGRGQA